MNKQDLIDMINAGKAARATFASGFSHNDLDLFFVVECDGLIINPNGKPGLGTRTCTLQQAPLYTKDVAQNIARRVVNGKGTRGEAVSLREALARAEAGDAKLLAFVEGSSK